MAKSQDSFSKKEKETKSFLGVDISNVWDKITEDSLYVIFKQAKEDGFDKIEDAINSYFSPYKFNGTDIDDLHNFNTMDWSKISNLDEYDFYEFWTESECLLYYIGNFNAGSDIEFAYKDFIDEFIK